MTSDHLTRTKPQSSQELQVELLSPPWALPFRRLEQETAATQPETGVCLPGGGRHCTGDL